LIRKAVEDEPTLLSPGPHSLEVRVRRLVLEPFKRAVPSVTSILKGPWLIVIDGLDECVDHDEVEEFIIALLFFFEENPKVPLRFLIASRVEQHIHRHLQSDSVSLENLIDYAPDADIKFFLRMFFQKEAKTNRVIRSYGDWPTKDQISKLVEHIGGSFIFAATFARYILGRIDDDIRLEEAPLTKVQQPPKDGLTPMERLELALNINPGLDGLYAHILSRAEESPHFPKLLLCLCLRDRHNLSNSIADIADMLACETFRVTEILVKLQAIVQVPGDDHTPVTFFHTSVHDFLRDEGRSHRFSSDSLLKAFGFNGFDDLQNLLTVWDPQKDSQERIFQPLIPWIRYKPPIVPQFNINKLRNDALTRADGHQCLNTLLAILLSLPFPHADIKIQTIADVLRTHRSSVMEVLQSLRPFVLINTSLFPSPAGTETVFRVSPHLLEFLQDPIRSGRFYFSEDRVFKQRLDYLDDPTSAVFSVFGAVMLLFNGSWRIPYRLSTVSAVVEALPVAAAGHDDIGLPSTDVLDTLSALFPLVTSDSFDTLSPMSSIFLIDREFLVFLASVYLPSRSHPGFDVADGQHFVDRLNIPERYVVFQVVDESWFVYGRNP